VIARDQLRPGVVRGSFAHPVEDGRRTQCDLCPRYCKLQEGQRGFCFIRQAQAGAIELTSYGRASGFCMDPIEKKPLNHFHPGSSVLSFGTAGCNLGCRFCQNWDISRAREMERLTDVAGPEAIADAAVAAGARSIAFTYNDPVIFAEYAIDCAQAARARGLASVAVTAGYITREARPAFFEHIDAANVDLKAFTNEFYRKQCLAELEPVLDTLRWLKHETNVWLEVTTLLIPRHNDSDDELARLCDWFARELGVNTPLHFTAFHPDFKLTNLPATPTATLQRARGHARRAGLRYVYTGNVTDLEGQATLCAGCGKPVIERDRYTILGYHLDAQGRCDTCSSTLPGRFDPRVGSGAGRRTRLTIV
jgi:pyruvate formate lyase activating enzyme